MHWLFWWYVDAEAVKMSFVSNFKRFVASIGNFFSFWFVEIQLGCLCLFPVSLNPLSRLLTAIHLKELKIIWQLVFHFKIKSILSWCSRSFWSDLFPPAFLASSLSTLHLQVQGLSFLSTPPPWPIHLSCFHSAWLCCLISSVRLSLQDSVGILIPPGCLLCLLLSLSYSFWFPKPNAYSSVLGLFRLTFVHVSALPLLLRLWGQGILWGP